MNFKNILKSKPAHFIAATMVLSISACTNLDEKVRDEVLNTEIPAVEATMAAVYDRLGDGTFADNGGMIAMQEYTSDEAMLPTRGSDWGDGGKWRDMHEFTWSPVNPILTDNWNRFTNGIARAATAIQNINANTGNDPVKPLFLAEAKAMYDYYMWYTLDLYNQAPYRDPALASGPVVMKYAPEAIDELIVDLESLIPQLASLGEQSTNAGRFTKEAAYAVLADMYLNRAVFKDRFNATSNFNYTEAAVSGGGSDMDRVIYYTSLLINSGKFQLASNYFSNFDIDNANAPEHIFKIIQKVDQNHSSDNDLGYVNVERNQRPSPSNRGTNAACATPEFFHSWDGNHNDPRFQRMYQYASDGTWFKNDGTDTSVPATSIVPNTTLPWFHFNRGIMYGLQYGPVLNDKGGFVMDGTRIKVQALVMEKNTGTPMDFTPEMKFDNPMASVLTQNQLNQGARIFKWEFSPYSATGADNGQSEVDIALYRLGGIYTMRAEAYFRKGDNANALADINILRTSRTREAYFLNAPGVAIPSLDADILYKEIGFELYWEMKRRPQMIRFGKFDLPGTAKAASQPFRRAFPIPQSAIDVNKQIKQNDGY